MLPYWCWSSLMRVQLAPALSERNTPCTPSTVPIANTAGYVDPGAALPKPTFSANVVPATFANEVPPSVEWNSPVLPASQMSPSTPDTAWNRAVVGSPVAAVAVNEAPAFVLV